MAEGSASFFADGHTAGKRCGQRPVPSRYPGELRASAPEPARQSRVPSLGLDAAVPLDEAMEYSDEPGFGNGPAGAGRHYHIYLAVVLIAAAVYLGCIISPPSLMDDVDAVQAQIARNMIASGDWVTARLDGIAYLEKAPLIYWAIAISYKVFGVHDWSARIPVVLSSIGLAWITAAFGVWAFGRRAGLYAGLAVGTCVGLFLFT